MATRGTVTLKGEDAKAFVEALHAPAPELTSLHANAVAFDEIDQDPGEAPEASTAEERSRDYQNGVREGALRVIEYVEVNWGEVGRMAAGEARRRWKL